MSHPDPAAPPIPAMPVPFAAPAPAIVDPAAFAMPNAPATPTAALDASVPLTHAMPSVDHQLAQPIAMPVAPPTEAPAADGGASDRWIQPDVALVLAVAAVAWQFVAFHAREQLPALQSSGAVLDNFDRILGSMPLVGSTAGIVVGVALALGSLGLLLAAGKQGRGERGIQAVVAGVAVVSLLLVVALPALAG